jgi:Holliday junction resolvase RusA-like endonuclease
MGKRSVVYMTKKGREVKESYYWQAKKQWRGKEIMTGSLEAKVILYFGDERRRDIDNYNKIWQDALEGVVFQNDEQIEKMTIEKKHDHKNPRIEVFIKKIK